MTGIKAEDIKKLLTEEKIIELLENLGSETYHKDNNGNLIFKTVCHGGDSYKLYYYLDSEMFRCYTDCSASFDVFELVKKTLGLSFQESLNYIADFFSFKFIKKTLDSKSGLTSDWEIIDKYNFLTVKEEKEPQEVKFYDESVLSYFSKGLHESWYEDGISQEAANKYDIRFDESNNRIIIPHRELDGKLVGIRVRNLDEYSVSSGKKYMPLFLQNEPYSHSLGANLYGLYENLESIKKYGKIVLFESEKSVLQCESFYPDNNFAVATCGSSISNFQTNMILGLGVKEVFIAFDKEYENAFSPQSDKYAEKIIRLAQKFAPYLTTYVIWDTDGLLSYKDAPSDKGKKILEKLMKSKFEIKSEE